MPEHTLVTEQQRDQIVKAYLRGAKIRDIEQQFGVKRATIYWILEKDGHAPNRTQRGRRLVGDDQALAQLYEVIDAQEKRIKQLERAGLLLAQMFRDELDEGLAPSKRAQDHMQVLEDLASTFGPEQDESPERVIRLEP